MLSLAAHVSSAGLRRTAPAEGGVEYTKSDELNAMFIFWSDRNRAKKKNV